MRPEVFLYQAGAPPIVLGELPVTPVLPADSSVEMVDRELIEGGAPFNHFIPEVVIAPCWVQDYSIPPLERQLIDSDYSPIPIIPAPVVFCEWQWLDDLLPIDRPLVDGFQFDPSAAANVIVPIWTLDTLFHESIAPRDVDLIYDTGYVPLREVGIVPLNWFIGQEDLGPRVLELLGTEAQTPVFVAPPVLMDWFVQHPDLPLEVRAILDSASVATDSVRHVPQIQGFWEGLSRDAVRQMQELVAQHFQTQIEITPEAIFVQVCSIRAEPAIGVEEVDSSGALDISGTGNEPAIRIDSAGSDPVC